MRGWPRRSFTIDRYLVSIALILSAAALLRLVTVWPLDEQGDDVDVTYEALDAGFGPSYVFGQRAGHWGPVTRAIIWPLVHADGFNFRFEVIVAILISIAAQAACYLLFVRFFGRGALTLALTTGLSFSVLWITMFTQWSTAIPLSLALLFIALLVRFQLEYLESGERKHLVGLTLALVGGLASTPQFIPYVWFGAAIAAIAPWSYLRTVEGVRSRLWRVAIAYVAVLIAYAIAYLSIAQDRVGATPTLSKWWNVFWAAIVQTFWPGLVGGPWSAPHGQWQTTGTLGVLGLTVVVGVVAVVVGLLCITRKGAWLYLAVAALLTVALTVLLVLTVTTMLTFEVFRQTRYTSLLLLPILVLLGLAWRATTFRKSAERPIRAWFSPRDLRLALGGVVLVLLASTLYTSVHSLAPIAADSTRPYWQNVSSSFAANPDVSIIDRIMPVKVVNAAFLNGVGKQSEALKFFVTTQQFNAPAAQLWEVTEKGELQLLPIVPIRSSAVGPVFGCGYRISTAPKVIPTGDGLFSYEYIVTLNYVANAAMNVRVAVDGGKPTDVPVLRGSGSVSLVSAGNVRSVTVSNPSSPATEFCVLNINVGLAG